MEVESGSQKITTELLALREGMNFCMEVGFIGGLLASDSKKAIRLSKEDMKVFVCIILSCTKCSEVIKYFQSVFYFFLSRRN